MSTRLAALAELLFPTTPAWGAEVAADDERHGAVPAPTDPAPAAEQVVVRRLSEDLGIPAATLWAQRQRTKLGWGDLLIANRLAQKTGLAFNRVVAELEGEALFHIIWAALAARRLGGSQLETPKPLRNTKGGTR